MSWRTRGLHTGLSEAEREFLDAFNKGWDTKDEGRYQQDALDRPLERVIPVIPAQEMEFNGIRDANFILAMIAVKSFSVPKRSPHGGYRIRIRTKADELFMIHFRSLSDAQHLYDEMSEFKQWFRST